jgi:hypothetical protein
MSHYSGFFIFFICLVVVLLLALKDIPFRSHSRYLLSFSRNTPLTLAITVPERLQRNIVHMQFESCAYWHGYENISHVFAFGDSFTTIDFKVTGTQPTSGNPTGNRHWTKLTSANGPNWLDYFITRYNVSEIMAYNIAFGGATVDSALAKPIFPSNARSLKQQIRDDWLPVYGSIGSIKGKYRGVWDSENSLFMIWMGINDVFRTYETKDPELVSRIFDQYEMLIGEVCKVPRHKID